MMAYPEFFPGDVFLFEHDDSCISRLICRLSHSPISHAAMYFEDGKIIEEGLPHIGTRPITKLGNRAVHVRRHARCKESSEALRKAARKHLEAQDPYSMGNLIMVGVLLAFKAWKPDARWAVKRLFSGLCMLLAKAIDRKKSPGKHGATCSQLVYEMYEEAGFRLHIVQRDRAVAAEANLLAQALAWAEAGAPPANGADTSAPTALEAAGHFDMEKLCCALLLLLDEEETDKASPQAQPHAEEDGQEAELYEEVVRFASLVHQADTPEPALQADRGLLDWGKKSLEHLMENYAGFVSPGQLYTDCPDLSQEIAVITPEKA